MQRAVGWIGLVVLVLAVWGASLRWALVWSTTGTVGRVYGGKILYRSYEKLFVEAQWPRASVVRRVSGDYCGALCHEVQVTIPLSWGALPSAACASLLVLVRRRRGGACAGCGYDLAGLPTATVCPECGRDRK